MTKAPGKAEYRAEMVTATMLPMGLEKQAFVEAVRAIHVDPQCAKAYRSLAMAEYTVGRVADAVQSFDKQLELAPNDPQALLDRANVAMDAGDNELAERLCRKILESDNNYGGEALHYIALSEYRRGNYEKAIEIWDWSLEAKCFYPEVVKWNQSLAMLCVGRYREGWKLHQARGKSMGDIYSMEMFSRFRDKRLDDDLPPAPARLHISQEMGFGDCLIMMRYLPLLIERGYAVQLEVDSGLIGLLEYNFPDVRVIRKAPDFPGTVGIPEFDYYIPALNLPVLFNTEMHTIPSHPILKADPALVAQYRKKVCCLAHRPVKIGLCWASGLFTGGINARWHAEFNRRKSVGLKQLAKLPSDCSYFSLQIGPTREKDDAAVLDVLPENPSWKDTAAVIACCDLVVSVDTGVAHLAASMGKPVWLMMHTECAWPWFAERPGANWNERSPWYPSVRLFRQKKPHEWAGVIERIASELEQQQLAA